MSAPKRRRRQKDPNSRRYQTTRAGRRGERDLGSDLLRQRKLIITGRDDVEVTAAGILYGRSLITRFEFDKLSFISLLLTRSAAAFGRGYPVAALWASVLGAAIRSSPRAEPVTGDRGARTQLAEVCRRLNGCRSLVIALAEEQMPALAIRAAERRLTAGDRLMLQELRDSLDGIRLPPWVTRAEETTEEARR